MLIIEMPICVNLYPVQGAINDRLALGPNYAGGVVCVSAPLSREASVYFQQVRNMVGVCCCLLVPGSDPLQGEMAGKLGRMSYCGYTYNLKDRET